MASDRAAVALAGRVIGTLHGGVAGQRSKIAGMVVAASSQKVAARPRSALRDPSARSLPHATSTNGFDNNAGLSTFWCARVAHMTPALKRTSARGDPSRFTPSRGNLREAGVSATLAKSELDLLPHRKRQAAQHPWMGI